jgi:phosphinothricin acetyltransferase
MEGILRCRLEPISPKDGDQIMEIYNYVEDSFAAFPERKVPSQFFNLFMNVAQGYPFLTAKNEEGKVLGFGHLHAYNSIPSTSRTAKLIYFLPRGRHIST